MGRIQVGLVDFYVTFDFETQSGIMANLQSFVC